MSTLSVDKTSIQVDPWPDVIWLGPRVSSQLANQMNKVNVKAISAVQIVNNVFSFAIKSNQIVELLSVMESSRTCPWPRESLRTHFQVLGLGLVAHVLGLGLGLESQVLGLVKFSVTQVYWHAAKKVLMIRAKTVIYVSSFPSWQDVTTLVMRFCHKPGVPARGLWHDVPHRERSPWHRLWGLCCMSLAFGLCPWPWQSSPWPWSWPRGLCPWPCHLCPWLHHWLLFEISNRIE